MVERSERFIKSVYKKWKSSHLAAEGVHPDEEILAAFCDGLLDSGEEEEAMAHIISCEACAESLALTFDAADITSTPSVETIARIKGLLELKGRVSLIGITLRLKEKVLELINATGDVLVGQELIPAPVLRSRHISEFKDELVILKEIDDLHLEARVKNNGGSSFNILVLAKERRKGEVFKGMRVTLIENDIELESYSSDAGEVVFENIKAGRYIFEISGVKDKPLLLTLEVLG